MMYPAIDRGNKLFGMKTNNIVEQLFSWLLKERSLSIYYFIVQMLKKVFATNTDTLMEINNEISFNNEKMLDQRKTLTTYASQIYTQRQIIVSRLCFDIDFTGDHTASVTKMIGNKFTAETFSVNLLLKTCGCCEYNQFGIPCIHAIAAANKLRLNMIDVNNYVKFFDEIHWFQTLVKMSTECQQVLTGVIPDTHKINQLKSNPTITYHNIKPKILMDVSSKSSYSRIKSTGDIGGKGISLKAFKKKLVPCPLCGKYRSSNKIAHLPSPCQKFSLQHPEFIGAQSLLLFSKYSFDDLKKDEYLSDDELNSENQSDISISNENEEIDKDDKDIYSDYLKTLGKDCSDESFLEKISLSS